MAIGASKIGVLGGKALTPGGSQTFNSPGTFSVPKGISIVKAVGYGGAGNAGNGAYGGVAGGAGGGGGGSGSIYLNNPIGAICCQFGKQGGAGGRTGCPCTQNGGNRGLGLFPAALGKQEFRVFPVVRVQAELHQQVLG